MRCRHFNKLLWYALLPITGACAAHGVTHTAPDESRPHISWEIRTGSTTGDDDLVCASSQPSPVCVLAASTKETSALATVHLFLHAAAQPTIYKGGMRVPFISGSGQNNGTEVSADVAPGSQPVGTTVSGLVTSKPGRYALTISLDATQPGTSTPLRVAQEIPVTVK
jgi:hypothetical protein